MIVKPTVAFGAMAIVLAPSQAASPNHCGGGGSEGPSDAVHHAVAVVGDSAATGCQFDNSASVRSFDRTGRCIDARSTAGLVAHLGDSIFNAKD